MKVKVNIQTLGNDVVSAELTASPEDTVDMIKERVLLVEPNPFTEHSLTFKGKPLLSGSLAACGISEGAVLDFAAQASEQAFAEQLEQLLVGKGPLSVEELGLLYTLRHGVTPGLVLQSIGKQQISLSAFLQQDSSRFSVVNDQVVSKAVASEVAKPLACISEDIALQCLTLAVSVTIELPYAVVAGDNLSLKFNACDSISSVKDRVAAEAMVPFPSREVKHQGKCMDDRSSLAACGVVDGGCLAFVVVCTEFALVAQLLTILHSRGPTSCTDLNDLYCCRFGVGAAQALKLLGWGEKLTDFMKRHEAFIVDRGCVAAAATELAPPPRHLEDNNRFLKLHAELCDSLRDATLLKELDSLAASITAESFLDLSKVVKAGALVKGLAVPGDIGAELVLFVRGLVQTDRERWLPGLVASVAAILPERLMGKHGVQGAWANADSVILSTTGGLGEVRLLFSPDYSSCGETLRALKCQTPDCLLSAGEAAFVAQKLRFIERQPEGVKATIRLLRWWRSQHQWQSASYRPSDDILELVAVHRVAAHAPADLRGAVAGAMCALEKFSDLEVTWPLSVRSYRESDMSPTLMKQRPLLMDPTSPLVNHAAAPFFNPSEMMQRAAVGFTL